MGFLFQVKNYQKPLGFIIDTAYFGGKGTNANTGYIATAYAELGIIGVIIASILLGFVIYVIYLASRKSNFFAFVTGSVYIFELINSSIFQLFLTDYFLIYILIVYTIDISSDKFIKIKII
ncbi:hypothetical protein [Marinitoga lauensis]|uniref:hypothetical protein n=1 Tax=Marinitoga lauensis TaxID=2201189 RepID=UPI00197F8837|nr:hypothetical protein [Marinitoga lauensis]